GSPAINKGDNALVKLIPPPNMFDQRGPGFPRISPAGGTVDIGAFEVQQVVRHFFAASNAGGGGFVPTPPPIHPTPIPNFCIHCSCLDTNICVLIPIVSIIGELTADNQNIGTVIFTICDT